MINKIALTQFVNQSVLNQYAALSDEAKAALLNSKENFLQMLKSGDVLEGILFRQNGENILLEPKTGLQLSTILLEDLPDNLPENIKLQFIVRAVEDGKLHLAFKQPQKLEQPKMLEDMPLLEKITKTLNLPQNQEMVKVIDTFTQFELPLDRKLLMQTYSHVQTTKLPESVLVNILKQLDLNSEEAFKVFKDFKDIPLQQVIKDLLEDCLHTVKENKQMATQLIRTLAPFVPDKGLFEVVFNRPNLDGLEESLSKEPFIVEKFVKLFSKSLSTFTHEDLEKGVLREQLMFKDSECLKELVKMIKSAPKLLEGMQEKVTEIEMQLPAWQKLNEQGSYFTFPWMTNLGEAKGEVYFYKSKKYKKSKEQDFYTVIALDMPYLKHIEAHIHQISTHLEITFYTMEDYVSDMINGQLSKLVCLLNDKGYSLSKCSCQVAKSSKRPKSFIKEVEEGMRGIDFKI